jgi:hypothetical protein
LNISGECRSSRISNRFIESKIDTPFALLCVPNRLKRGRLAGSCERFNFQISMAFGGKVYRVALFICQLQWNPLVYRYLVTVKPGYWKRISFAIPTVTH